MRPLAKAALCGGLAYCGVQAGRAIWTAPGWCALIAIIALVNYAFGADFIEVVRAALGIICLFWVVGIIGLWLTGSGGAALVAFFGMLFFVEIAAMFVKNDAVEAREAARHARELASQTVPAAAVHDSSTFVIPTVNGILVLLVTLGVVFGLIALCRTWNRRRQYDRQLEAFNFALRYEPDARFTCEPPKLPSRKPRAKPQAPEPPYQPPIATYHPPVYQPPVQQPGWLAQGRREAGLG